METRVLLLAVISLLAVSTAVSATPRRSALLGTYKPIEDPKDPHVVEIGEFAVSENNKLQGTKLEYVEVVKGETQVVKGTNYRLTISAKDGGDEHSYLAVVYEGLSAKDRSLVSFHRMLNH